MFPKLFSFHRLFTTIYCCYIIYVGVQCHWAVSPFYHFFGLQTEWANGQQMAEHFTEYVYTYIRIGILECISWCDEEPQGTHNTRAKCSYNTQELYHYAALCTCTCTTNYCTIYLHTKKAKKSSPHQVKGGQKSIHTSKKIKSLYTRTVHWQCSHCSTQAQGRRKQAGRLVCVCGCVYVP